MPSEFRIDSISSSNLEQEERKTLEGFYTGSIPNIQKKRRKSKCSNRSSSPKTSHYQIEEPAFVRLSSPKPNPEADKARRLRSAEKTPR